MWLCHKPHYYWLSEPYFRSFWFENNGNSSVRKFLNKVCSFYFGMDFKQILNMPLKAKQYSVILGHSSLRPTTQGSFVACYFYSRKHGLHTSHLSFLLVESYLVLTLEWVVYPNCLPHFSWPFKLFVGPSSPFAIVKDLSSVPSTVQCCWYTNRYWNH